MKYCARTNALFALLAALPATTLAAEAETPAEATPEPAFAADRPGFADGTTVVPPLRIQTEGGVTGVFADGVRAYSVPDLLVRVGLTDWLEARLAAPTFNLVQADGADSLSGLGDLGLGVKLAHAFGEALSASLVAGVSLPTGGDEFTSDGFDPEVELNVAYDASERLSLGANAKFGYATEPGEGETSGSLSLGIGITEDLGAFIEGIGVKPAGDFVAAAGAGVTYMAGAATQLDVSFTMDLSGTYFDKTLGAGVAVLW